MDSVEKEITMSHSEVPHTKVGGKPHEPKGNKSNLSAAIAEINRSEGSKPSGNGAMGETKKIAAVGY